MLQLGLAIRYIKKYISSKVKYLAYFIPQLRTSRCISNIHLELLVIFENLFYLLTNVGYSAYFNPMVYN